MATLQSREILLVFTIAIYAQLLMVLSSRRRRSSHPVFRYILWGLSAVYLPLMFYVVKDLTTQLTPTTTEGLNPTTQAQLSGSGPWYAGGAKEWLVLTVILIQFLKAKADIAALSLAAVTTPAAGDDGTNSLKVRPSMESLIYSFWVAGLVIYNVVWVDKKDDMQVRILLILKLLPLWVLGACRMLLRFIAFHRATGSFAFGRNVQLMDGYMTQLQEEVAKKQLKDEEVPGRLIVTGERNQDVQEIPLGYRIKPSSLKQGDRSSSRLVTVDQVWSSQDKLVPPRHKDLCLSFALFKCLRRRFAGYELSEAGSTWAFRFVQDGLLGQKEDNERIFRVISDELGFASDFYYSHLHLASLGSRFAALYFLLSSLIISFLCLLLLSIVYGLFEVLLRKDIPWSAKYHQIFIPLPVVLALFTACVEVYEMVAGVRSNWTKIKIIGHLIGYRDTRGYPHESLNSSFFNESLQNKQKNERTTCLASLIKYRNHCVRKVFACLITCWKPQKQWKVEIGQIDLFNEVIHPRKNGGDKKPVTPEVRDTILKTFRNSGRQLSYSTATVHRQRQAFHHDVAWACHGGELTTTDAILVWCIATRLFEMRMTTNNSNMRIASWLSRYCMYLLVEAPDLLPDNSTWAKGRYQKVKEELEAGLGGKHKIGGAQNLVHFFNSEPSHEVLKNGSRLWKRLVKEADQRRRSKEGNAKAGDGDDIVWEVLAVFWSKMLLYLAPSNNIKGHMEVLQRGGELITLLWALLLHAGITSRQARHDPEA